MFTRILVPLDGSALAEAILREVEEVARLHSAEVVLLRVALAHTFPGGDPTEAQVRAVEEAVGYLADVERGLAARGIKVGSVVRYGRAAEEILDHAQTSGADLIAMSTHGRSGVQRWVLGSVAETVLRASPVPVLLLRAEPQAAPEAEPGAQRLAAPVRPQTPERPAPPIRHILCPVDFSQNANEAMEHAGALAPRFHARLTVLHVVYNPLDITGSHIPHPPLEQLREEMIRAAEEGLRERVHQNLRGVREAQTVVVAGPPSEQIVRYARAHQVDLIVMGTQGLSGLDHLIMGSTAERVIRTAPCPVLTIRAAA